MSENVLSEKLLSKLDLQNKRKDIKNRSSLSSNLKELLRIANISEHELSRRTNIAQPIIHRLVTGENINPKLMTLKPIANYFTVTVSQLIGEQDIKETWTGFTSNEHLGWGEIPLINSKRTTNTENKKTKSVVVTDCVVSEKAFAVYVTDSSMEPIIPNNSISIIEPEIDPCHGEFVALKNKPKDIIIRNFFLIDKKYWICPINREYGTLTALSSDYEIVGTVVRTIYDPRVIAKK